MPFLLTLCSNLPLILAAVGTAIEFWKVTKAFDVSLLNTFPFISVKDKASYKDSRHNTNKHDAQAMRYLSYALYPCVIGEPGVAGPRGALWCLRSCRCKLHMHLSVGHSS